MLTKNDAPRKLRPATVMVHGGTTRSRFGETSEALFLTQGFVYDSAEAAEARFKGEEPGFIYSRYANPTTRMFEERMMALEGAEDARATASGMAAVAAALQCQVKAGDHVVAARALFGSCRYIVETVLKRCGVSSTLVDGRDLDAWRAAVRPETKAFFLEIADQSDAGGRRHRRRRRDRPCGGGDAGRRQRLRDADAAAPAGARRRRRRLFRDQAHRRPGPLPRRHRPVLEGLDRREPPRLFPPHRPVAVAVQRLDAAEGSGDAAGARRAADRRAPAASPTRSPAIPGSPG